MNNQDKNKHDSMPGTSQDTFIAPTDSQTQKEKTDSAGTKRTNEDVLKEIQKLRNEIAKLEKLVEPTPAVNMTNSSVMVDAKAALQVEKDNHERLIKIAFEQGPKLVRNVTPSRSLDPFSSPLAITRLNQIPSLFQIEVIGQGESESISHIAGHAPNYLGSSMKAFAFGITEARFVMKSTGFPHDIDFNPGRQARMLGDVGGTTFGPVSIESSKNDYVLQIIETMFLLFLNSQCVLHGVEFTTVFDRSDYAGDCVSTLSMLKTQYVNQNAPLLPAAGFGHRTRYLPKRILDMFTPSHRHMIIGERGRELLSQKKIFRRAAVITDQYTSRLIEIFLNYLKNHATDANVYVAQHQVLTLRHVNLRIQKPSLFVNSLVPTWNREECDGALLLYALNVSRQLKYLHHASALIASTNLISFATLEQVGDLPPRKNLQEPVIQQLLDNVLTNVTENDFTQALVLDMSTTWVDIDLTTDIFDTGPVGATFRLFNVLLWYAYFPSIARDNAPKLMYDLFSSLEMLSANKTEEYVRKVGFSTFPGRASTIQEYPKEVYYNGQVRFPLLEQQPTARYQLFQKLHDLLTHDWGSIVVTNDKDGIHTPRMSDVRTYYQPYNELAAISNELIDGETPNDLSSRLKAVRSLMVEVIEEYKKSYRFTSRATFGNTRIAVTSLIAFFQDFTPSIMSAIGIRGHAEIFHLRELLANSPFIIDCQNLGPKGDLERPQILVQAESGNWTPLQMQRLCQKLPMSLPLYTFLALRGAPSYESIMPPDVMTQYQTLQAIQQEGILVGDIIKFVNNIKFGNVGVFNREALGISSVITASRADKIFQRLAEMSALSQFKDIFQILINDVANRIDSRAIAFKISLQKYGSSVYNEAIPQPERSLYGKELRLGRPLLDEVMTTVSPLFVPETSPISLYTNGLVAYSNYQNDLNPFEFCPIECLATKIQRVVMWSTKLVNRRVKDEIRFLDEDILQLPNEQGEMEEYQLKDVNMPFTLIIVTANTGQIGLSDFRRLKRFFKEKKIAFLFPELMVIMNRVLVDQSVEEEIMLESQFEQIITGAPNRKVTLTFGDTISRPYRLSSTTEKLKYMYPISTVHQRDVVIRGMADPVEEPSELQIGSWMSWAFGGLDGKNVIVKEGENILPYHNPTDNVSTSERTIDKLQLGMVNMNNEVSILTSEELIVAPPLEQDISRVYVDIYSMQ